MQKIKVFSLMLLAVLMLASCATGTDITQKNNDGSPIWTTVIPESNKLLYGVGSAKFSTEKNSRDASYSAAVADLARKVSVRIQDASSAYSSDADSELLTAYENVRTLTVNVTLKGVKTVDRWKAEDGTVWTLVSLEAKRLPEIYSDAANNWKAQQEEKKLSIMNKLVALKESLGDRNDDKAVEIRSLAEERAGEMIVEIEQLMSAMHFNEITENITADLAKDGYEDSVSDTEGDGV